MTMFTDNFNRANGAIGAGWVNVDAAEPFLVVDNAAHATVADTPALVAVDAAFDADQEASLTFTAVNVADRAGPAVRVDTANDTAYFIDADGFSGTDRRLVRWAAGVKTVIGTVNIAPVAGDRVTLRVVGSTLTVYVNGVLVDTVVDATHASGAPGMYYQRSNTGSTRLDDFVGTDRLVKFDAVGSATAAYQSASAVSPAPWNHTSAAKALILAWATGNGGDQSTWTATCDGVRMFPIGVGPALGSRLFGLFVENAGVHAIAVTHDNTGATLNANSISYVGCDPANPYSDFTAGVSGTGTNPAVAVPSVEGQAIVDFLFSRAAIEGLNQTAVARSTFTNGGAGQAIGEKRAVATSTQMGWTVQSSGDTSFDVALALNPAETDEYVVLDGSASAPAVINGGGPIAWDHEVSDADILLVALAANGSNPPDGTIPPTVDGTPCALVFSHTRDTTSGGGAFRFELWAHLSPAVGTRSIAYDRGTNVTVLLGGSLSYRGLNLDDLYGVEVVADGGNSPGATSRSVAAVAGDRVVDFLLQTSNSSRDMLCASPQVERIDSKPTNNDNNAWLKASDRVAGSTSVEMAWAVSSEFVAWSHYVLVLRAARTRVMRGEWQTSTTNTVPIIIPDEPNRVVEAAFTIEVRGSDFTTFPVTCGGVPMHEVVGSPSASPNGVAVVRRFYLLDSELPAAGAQNVVAAPTGGADVSYRSAAVVHTNVAQAAPLYIEAGEDITDTLRIPSGSATWAYADGDLATGILCGGDGTLVFAWPSPWDEHFDDADGTGDSRSTGGSRSYSGAGTDSVTVVAAGAQRTAGSVLVWSVASAGGGGGTAFEQATTGALAISGALARAVIRAAAGSVAPSAITTVTRAAVRAVSGSSAPAGAVVRRADRPAGGSTAPTGSVARTTMRETSGAVAGSGALETTRVTTQAVAGSVALEAAITRELRRALLASVAPTGTLSRRPARAVSGSAAPTAELARRMTRALSGSMAPSGATVPVRALTLAVGGAVAVSAFLANLSGRAVGGAVSPSGLATRAMRKALDGSAAPTGRAGRSVSRVLSGATQILGGVVAAIVGAIERVRGMRVTDRSEPTVLVTDESESAVLVTDRSESAVIVTDLSTL